MKLKDSNKILPHAEVDSATATITAIADIGNTPKVVFDALITDEVEKWWGDDATYRVTNWKADLRKGGKWSLVVVMPDGSAHPASGVFLQLDSPWKIVLTRRYDWDAPGLGRTETKVTYLLKQIDTGTNLTIIHEGFDNCLAAAYEHALG